MYEFNFLLHGGLLIFCYRWPYMIIVKKPYEVWISFQVLDSLSPVDRSHFCCLDGKYLHMSIPDRVYHWTSLAGFQLITVRLRFLEPDSEILTLLVKCGAFFLVKFHRFLAISLCSFLFGILLLVIVVVVIISTLGRIMLVMVLRSDG